MHPILGRPARLLAYLGVWVPLGMLVAALLHLQGVFGWIDATLFALPLVLAYGFLCLSAWYVTGGSPMDRVGAWRNALTAAIASFVSSAVWLLIARGWLAIVAGVRGWADVTPSFRLAAPTLFGFGFFLYLLAMAASYLAAAFAISQEAEKRGLELQVMAREAELRALRAQIDPHFLFNSLQSISALTTLDPAAARRMCLLLADFLRDTLALGARERIALSDELALARRFLEVEQVRYGDRLQMAIDAEPGTETAGVPPLVLQPLVENAVTHGIAHVLEGGVVRISTARQVTRLVVTVDNPCDADRPAGRGTGLGLRNVRERLESEYGPDARLRTAEADGRFVARLDIPLNA
jgi:two-component system, LytTR family, sensor histidine kinase AlgZ